LRKFSTKIRIFGSWYTNEICPVKKFLSRQKQIFAKKTWQKNGKNTKFGILNNNSILSISHRDLLLEQKKRDKRGGKQKHSKQKIYTL
jgi:hypothetical protein